MEALAFDISTAAAALGIGRSKLYEEIRAGRLQTVACGARRLVTRRALEEYVALLEREAGTGEQ